MAFSLRPRKPRQRKQKQEPHGRHRKAAESPARPGLTNPVFREPPRQTQPPTPTPMPTPPPPPVKEFSAPPTVPIPVVSEQPVPVVSEQPSQVVVSMDAVEVEVPQGSDRTNVSVILRSKRDGSILRLVGRRRQWTDIAKRLGILSDRGEK